MSVNQNLKKTSVFLHLLFSIQRQQSQVLHKALWIVCSAPNQPTQVLGPVASLSRAHLLPKAHPSHPAQKHFETEV